MKIKIALVILLLSSLGLQGCGARTDEAKNQTGSAPSNSSARKASGKIDACTLLTKTDAEALLGGAVKEPTTTHNENGGTVVTQCHYSNEAGDKQVGLLARQAPSAAEARQVFESARSAAKSLSGVDPKTISGLGDDAYWTGGNLAQLNVLKNDLWLVISARQGKADRWAATKDVANKVLSRLQ